MGIATVKVTGGGIEGLEAFLKHIKSGAFKADHSKVAFALSQRVAQLVRDEYRAHSVRPSGIHYQAIVQGKDVGASGPARPGRSAQSSMTLLSKSVVVTKVPHGYRIEIDPAARHPDPRAKHPAGVPLKLLAHWMENGTVSVMPVTLRMMGYIMSLQRRNAGPGKRKRPGNMPRTGTGRTIIVNKPAVPVWKNVANKLEKLQPLYTEDLRQRLQMALKHFGAR